MERVLIASSTVYKLFSYISRLALTLKITFLRRVYVNVNDSLKWNVFGMICANRLTFDIATTAFTVKLTMHKYSLGYNHLIYFTNESAIIVSLTIPQLK